MLGRRGTALCAKTTKGKLHTCALRWLQPEQAQTPLPARLLRSVRKMLA